MYKMKKKFSTKWKSSKQPRKQRKYRARAPLHIRQKLMAAHLSKQLREKYKTRSLPVRKGDKVRVMRGNFRGKEGKIEEVSLKRLKVRIEGITITKKDGSKAPVWFDPSNLQIVELNLDDKERLKAIERKKAKGKEEKAKEKNAVEKKKAKTKEDKEQAKKSGSKKQETKSKKQGGK